MFFWLVVILVIGLVFVALWHWVAKGRQRSLRTRRVQGALQTHHETVLVCLRCIGPNDTQQVVKCMANAISTATSPLRLRFAVAQQSTPDDVYPLFQKKMRDHEFQDLGFVDKIKNRQHDAARRVCATRLSRGSSYSTANGTCCAQTRGTYLSKDGTRSWWTPFKIWNHTGHDPKPGKASPSSLHPAPCSSACSSPRPSTSATGPLSRADRSRSNRTAPLRPLPCTTASLRYRGPHSAASPPPTQPRSAVHRVDGHERLPSPARCTILHGAQQAVHPVALGQRQPP